MSLNEAALTHASAKWLVKDCRRRDLLATRRRTRCAESRTAGMDGKGLMGEAGEGIVGSSVADRGRKVRDGIEVFVKKERRARACRK